MCPNALWFSKTRSRKAQKQAQFRDRSNENAIEKGSFVLVSRAISGEHNDEPHEHKNMILICLKRLNGDENESLNICIKMISGF